MVVGWIYGDSQRIGCFFVMAPFGDIADHIVNSPVVRFLLADGMGISLISVIGIGIIPGIVGRIVGVALVSPIERRGSAGTASVLPLCFGG